MRQVLNIPSSCCRSLAVSLVVFLSLPCFLQHQCFGQQASKRPVLGLALSGGGACGLAHIGVLKVMEEEGLKPDIITGVSMGSLIGAFYSAGFTADSLQKLCRNLDWDLIVSNKIPLSKIIFNEKKYFYNNFISLPLTFGKPKLPSGLINGQQLENALSYYLWNYADVSDFSRMPIPFMCLATDLITCKRVELRGGYLPDAVRASSAVPYIFKPLPIDSMLLVDGGVVRNFSAAEAKNMGADIIIGSYTGDRLRSAKELETIPGIVAQLGFFTSINDYESQKKLVNYLIEPRTSDIPATSFQSFDTLIARGYSAAQPFRQAFKRLADSLNRIGLPAKKEYIEKPRAYVFDSVEVVGNKFYTAEQVRGVLDISPGKQVTREMLSASMDLLYGKNWFEKVKYRIEKRNSSLILVIDCIENPKSALFGSIHYDNILGAGVVARFSFRDPLLRNSQVEINTLIGKLYRVNTSYNQFLGRNQKYSITGDFYADNSFIEKFEFDGILEGTYIRDLSAGLSFNRRLGLNNLLSFSTRYEYPAYTRDLLDGDGKAKYRYSFITAGFRYKCNTLNTWYFPDRGTRADVSLTASKLIGSDFHSDTLKTDSDMFSSSKLFYTFHISISRYFTRIKKWTFSTGAEILFITRSDSVAGKINNFFLGGTESLSPRTIDAVGFHSFEIPVTRMASVHLNIDYKVTEKVHLSLLSGVSVIDDLKNKDEVLLLPGFGLETGYLSVFGPVKAGVMFGYYRNEIYFTRLKAYLSIGFNF